MKYFDWKKALLNYYRNLDLNETDVTIIYLIDYINSEEEQIITPDLISLKSTLDYNTIDDILNTLMTKKYINIKSKDGKMVTSLDTIKEMLFELHILDINNNKKENKDLIDLYNELINTIETNFARQLCFIEKDVVKEWIYDGYRKDNILYALKETLNKKIKSINYMDKLLLKWRKQDERNNEGYTTITDKWHKDIIQSSQLTGFSSEKNNE